IQGDEETALLVALDLGWMRGREMAVLLERVAAGTGIASDRLVVTFSHTHSACNLDIDRTGDPGGHLIQPYLDALPGKITEAYRAARASLQPVELAYGVGRCDLGRNRDYWDEETKQYACGTNPGGPADETVMVVRVTDRAGHLLAHLVNYGCHPTTLAWQNVLISPDYIGAMREVVEGATGVPCVFLLGACGDIGPKDGYVGDTAVADRNGRQLGYAALSAIESLTPPGTEMRYAGPVVSGATLGTWAHTPVEAERLPAVSRVRMARLHVDLPFKHLPTRADLDARLTEWRAKEEAARRAGDEGGARDYRAHVERTRRALRGIEHVIPGGNYQYPIHLWQIGEGTAVLLSGEPYNVLQRTIRAHFPQTPLLVGVLCNQSEVGYLLPQEAYGKGIYQDSAGTLAPGCLERVIETITAQLEAWGCR
ncbi:MAG: hypothetical protein HY710_05035, partial [Candidatus Latescibacteria bacterium]|nr:hypothetical protein [Candidatus Latescibacterota bacterium]